MTNEMSLNLYTYSTSFYIEMKNIMLYGSWFIRRYLFPGSKVFLSTHAGNIIIDMGDKASINGSEKTYKTYLYA
jgi:hypothetical protein